MDSPDLDFEFVDTPLKAVLDDYYRQAQRSAAAEGYIGVIVGCGSVVEGLLTWALLLREQEALKCKKAAKDRQGEALPVQQWGLAHLIEVSAELDAIGKTARQASWALKDFRNFIHPYNVLQQSARPDRALAMSSIAALAEIRRSLQNHLQR